MKNHTEKIKTIIGTDDAWESRKLGAEEKYAVADEKLSEEMDAELELQMISIRLSKDLINSFKLLGNKYGMGYQPLMREALKRFADGEFKMIAKEMLEEQVKNRRSKQTKVA